MFKISSFENQIAEEMQKNLLSQQHDNIFKLNNLVKAAELINNATTIFEKAGYRKEAFELSVILSKLANKIIDNK